jgi:hypothetical protein
VSLPCESSFLYFTNAAGNLAASNHLQVDLPAAALDIYPQNNIGVHVGAVQSATLVTTKRAPGLQIATKETYYAGRGGDA